MTAITQIEKLLEDSRKPAAQMNRIKDVSNSMFDFYVMSAISKRMTSVSAVAKHLKLTEKSLLDNLNPKLFTTCDTGLGNMTIGLTRKALGL